MNSKLIIDPAGRTAYLGCIFRSNTIYKVDPGLTGHFYLTLRRAMTDHLS